MLSTSTRNSNIMRERGLEKGPGSKSRVRNRGSSGLKERVCHGTRHPVCSSPQSLRRLPSQTVLCSCPREMLAVHVYKAKSNQCTHFKYTVFVISSLRKRFVRRKKGGNKAFALGGFQLLYKFHFVTHYFSYYMTS